MSTLKAPNTIRRPIGRPRRNFGTEGWEHIHTALADILNLCRFRSSDKDHVRLIFEGHLLDLKKQAQKILNLIERIELSKKEEI